jgi:hypothetical protein
MMSRIQTIAAITVAFATATGMSQQRNSQPMVSDITLSKATVTDVHVKPLFTTTTMQSGETISMRLISDGSTTFNAPVDFIVDYKPQQSFFVGSFDPMVKQAQQEGVSTKHIDPLDSALEGQSRVATPAWQQGTALGEKAKKTDPSPFVGALGEIRESSGKMLVAYSVRNQSNHWIEVLPPQIEMSNPGDKSQIKKKDKKHIVEGQRPAASSRPTS